MSAAIALSAMLALCPGHNIVEGDSTMTDMDSRVIYFNRAELERHTQATQRFMISHECGHARGYESEFKADDYAFRHVKLNRPMLDEICAEFRSDEFNYPRCQRLRRLYYGADGKK